MKLFQIVGAGVEEIYEFEEDILPEQVEDLWNTYMKSEPSKLFDRWVNEYHPEIAKVTRIFPHIIYVR